MIYGDRIRFRRAERSDLPTFISWINDPDVRAGISTYLPMSMAQEEKWFEKMLERHQDEQSLVIEVKEGETWVTIGNCGFFEFDRRVRSAEFGILIGEKSYWNQGYGTEVTKMALKLAFTTLNLHRVMLRVLATNPGAIRAYEKSGYVHEGTYRDAEFLDGKYVDLHVMSVLRPEWQQRHSEAKT